MALRVLVYRVGCPSSIERLEKTLAAWQKIVGGYIERLPIAKNLALYLNEEGRIRELPVNRTFPMRAPVPQGYDFIVAHPDLAAPGEMGMHTIHGDFFAIRERDDGEAVGLEDADIDLIRTLLGA